MHFPGFKISRFSDKFRFKPFKESYFYTNTEEALDMIDEESKKYFPMVFFSMMVVYWTVYLFFLVDEIPAEQRQTYSPP